MHTASHVALFAGEEEISGLVKAARKLQVTLPPFQSVNVMHAAGEQGLSNFVGDWAAQVKGPGIGDNRDTLPLDSLNHSLAALTPPISPSGSGSLGLPTTTTTPVKAVRVPASKANFGGLSLSGKSLTFGLLTTLSGMLAVFSGVMQLNPQLRCHSL
jgi:hypothetical protein